MTQLDSKQKAYVVIVNFRGWSDTIECLESLLRLTHNNYRIVVVENGSGDDSIDKIEQWAAGKLQAAPQSSTLSSFSLPPAKKPVSFVRYDRATAERGGDSELEMKRQSAGDGPPVIIIDTHENLGFAGGNNVALRYIEQKGDHDFVWLLNNDTIVAPESLSKMIDRISAVERAGICGSTIRYYHDPDVVQVFGGGVYNRWLGWNHFLDEQYLNIANIDKADVEQEMSYVCGASMMVSRAFLDSIGELCEDYFLYFEELDWAWRGRRHFRSVWASDCEVFHKAGASIKSDARKSGISRVSEYYIQRNKILFTRKFFPWALPTIYVGFVLAILKRLLKGRWDQAFLLVKIALFMKRPDGIPGIAK